MIVIPPVYYSKSILSLIENHIFDGFKKYEYLCESDKSQLSAECIKLLGNDAYEALLDDADLSKFVTFLETGDIDSALIISENMKRSAINYFGVFLSPIFEEMYEKNENEIYHEQMKNYYPRTETYDAPAWY